MFNEYLEFKINYSKSLAPNNGSWTLVKNWRHGIVAKYYQDFKTNIFREVTTLSNGRTYAFLDNYGTKGYVFPELVELRASGNIRYTGVMLKAFSKDIMTPAGDLIKMVTTNVIGNKGHWEYRKLNSYDTAGNPVWGKIDTLAKLPVIQALDPAYSESSYPEITSSNMLVVFNPGRTGDGYHLGAVKTGDTSYLWKTAMATNKAYKGVFPADGGYDIGNNVEYPGGHVYAVDKNIFWNYHGEFWKNSQTNIWNHVYDNGLMIGQFGIPSLFAETRQSAPMCAGNVFSATIVKSGSDYYIYHNDESVHGGVHRWKVSGLNTINEQTIYISNTIVNGGLTAVYFDGTDLNSFSRKLTRVDTIVNLSATPPQLNNPTSFSARWTGFVKPKYNQVYTFYTNTNKGVRLWIDNTLVIDQWKNASQNQYSYITSIKLEAGKGYNVRMDVKGGTATLSWSSTSQAKQIIPSANLIPSAFPDNNAGVDLMEGLPYLSVLENGTYGWNRNPLNEDILNYSKDEFWSVKTNVQSIKKDNPDISIFFRRNRNDSVYYVTRDLGKPVACIKSWKVTGAINYTGNTASWDQYGASYFDIVDDQGKIISRVTNELSMVNASYPTQVKCNGTAIVNFPDLKMRGITNIDQPFEILTDSTGVLFSYGNFTPIKVKLFDAKSNWKKPASIKLHFWGGASNYDRSVSVQKLKFIPNAPSVPTIAVKGSYSICQGDSVVLTASSVGPNKWSTGDTSRSIKVKATGNFFVSIKDNTGCVVPSDTTKIKVLAATIPTISASRSTVLCTGDSVILTSSASYSNLWSTGDTSASIKVKTAGSYSVKTKSAQGCVGTSAQTVVNVSAYPVAKIAAGGPTTFCSGGSVILTADTAKTYLWSNGANTRSITISTTGTYSVKVTNASGCSAISNAISVNANGSPATPTISASRSTALCTGDSVILTSSTASAYAWSNGATSQSIIVKTAGSYSVTISNGVGCSATSTSTSVTSNSNPSAPTITASGSKTFCQGDSVTLTSTAANAYLWSSGATSQSIKAKTAGSYSVKITDANGCSNTSASSSIVVNSLPTATITASGSKTFCQGDSVTLTSIAANAYLWSSGATIQSIKVKASGNFLVKITDNNSCSNTSTATSVTVNALPSVTITANGAQTFCDGDSVILTATAANAYLWNNGEQTANIKIKISGLYNVTVTDQNSCSATSSNNIVHVNPLPMATITANGSTTFCEGDSVTLTSSSAKSFLWNSKATTASIVVKNSGQFDVFITDVNGCSSKSNITLVQVNQLPLAEITLQQSPVLCDGDSVILTANVGQAYLWNTGVTTQQLIAKKSGLYNVIVTDGMGCSATARNIKVLINKPIVPIVIPLSSTTFCQGDSVILKSSNAKQYIWNSLAVNASVVVKSSVIMVVTTVDSNGCTASSLPTTVKVNTLPARPTIATNKSPEICVGDSVKLSVGTYNAYVWNNMSTKPEINIGDAGNYAVLVTDKNGCKAISYPLTIKVNSLPKVLITPDGPTTFCEGESVVLSANVSNTYLWNNNEEVQNILVDAPGIYTVTITDYKQCSNTSDPIIVVVNPLPKTPIITVSQNTLTCSVKINVQWYLNGTEIPGATKPQYTMTENGDYTVRISNGTCTVFSESFICKSFKSTNLLAINKVSSTNVFPNPTIGPLTIQLENAIGTQILITNAEGKMIYNAAYSEQIDLTGNAMGVYFITVISTQGKSTHKITLMN